MKNLLAEEEIGRNLQRIIKDKGVTQEAFGEMLGVDRKAVSNYVNVSGGKKPSNLINQIIALGVSGRWYLYGEGCMYEKGDSGKDDEMMLQAAKHLFNAFSIFNALQSKQPEQ